MYKESVVDVKNLMLSFRPKYLFEGPQKSGLERFLSVCGCRCVYPRLARTKATGPFLKTFTEPVP